MSERFKIIIKKKEKKENSTLDIYEFSNIYQSIVSTQMEIVSLIFNWKFFMVLLKQRKYWWKSFYVHKSFLFYLQWRAETIKSLNIRTKFCIILWLSFFTFFTKINKLFCGIYIIGFMIGLCAQE